MYTVFSILVFKCYYTWEERHYGLVDRFDIVLPTVRYALLDARYPALLLNTGSIQTSCFTHRQP